MAGWGQSVGVQGEVVEEEETRAEFCSLELLEVFGHELEEAVGCFGVLVGQLAEEKG